jgi:hypothetical protein
LPSASALVERIKALKAAHTIEAAPQRLSTRRAATTEEPVTTRIRHRITEVPASQPDAVPVQPVVPAKPVAPAQTAELMLFKIPMPRVSKPKPSYQQRVTRDKRQMSLF